MYALAKLPPEERRHFLRRCALAPLCLCLVAGLHAARVWTARQTPWKGGGFGMFSTIDSESNRFLRAYLLTDAGELPLEVPAAIDKTAAELRAAPTEAGLAALAQRLAGQQWRWADSRQQRQAATIGERQGAAITAAELRSSPAEAPLSPPAGGQPHVLEPIPKGQAAAGAVAFRGVRVECWRLRFASATLELRGEQLLASTASSEEPQP